MEWFWNIVEQLQKSLAGSALQSFSLVDWIILLAIFWGLVQGSRKGFVDMFGKLFGIFLTSILTMSFYKAGASFVNSVIPAFPVKAAEPFVFFLLGAALWIASSWCINVAGKVLKVEASGLLKTLGGMALGGVRMVFILSFVTQFLLLLPIDSLQKTFKPGRTYTGYAISKVVPDLCQIAVSPFKKPAASNKLGG